MQCPYNNNNMYYISAGTRAEYFREPDHLVAAVVRRTEFQ